jgi:hypothetical protein
VRGQGAIGADLEPEPEPEPEPQLQDDIDLLQLLHLFLQAQEDLDLLHLLQTGESSKPSEPPTRTRRPSFLNPTRLKEKLAIPAPPNTKATIPIINIYFQVKFITPSNIMKYYL